MFHKIERMDYLIKQKQSKARNYHIGNEITPNLTIEVSFIKFQTTLKDNNWMKIQYDYEKRC